MSSKNWIEFPRVEGETSRQAHADLPAGTYEREIGRDGFFGPATHLYHKHPPTGWTAFEGPLRPRAFDAKAAFERLGLTGALSSQRSNGLFSMIERIRRDAGAVASAAFCWRYSASA